MFEYDDLTMHGNHNPHNARPGALLIHRPAWVDQHIGGSHLTPTVHRCPKGMAVGGSSPQQQHNTICLHTVQIHGKQEGLSLGMGGREEERLGVTRKVDFFVLGWV